MGPLYVVLVEIKCTKIMSQLCFAENDISFRRANLPMLIDKRSIMANIIQSAACKPFGSISRFGPDSCCIRWQNDKHR